MDNRVCFYSPNDLSIGYNLELAEKAIIKGSYIPPDPKPGGYNLCL